MPRIAVVSSVIVFILFAATVGLAQVPGDNVAQVGLEVEGKLMAFFQKVTQIGSRSEVLVQEVTDGATGEKHIVKDPGKTEVFDVTLERALSSSLNVWDWRQMVVDGDIDAARTAASIIFLAADNSEVARFNLERCWPSRVESNFPTGNGAVELLVLTCEEVSRISK